MDQATRDAIVDKLMEMGPDLEDTIENKEFPLSALTDGELSAGGKIMDIFRYALKNTPLEYVPPAGHYTQKQLLDITDAAAHAFGCSVVEEALIRRLNREEMTATAEKVVAEIKEAQKQDKAEVKSNLKTTLDNLDKIAATPIDVSADQIRNIAKEKGLDIPSDTPTA